MKGTLLLALSLAAAHPAAAATFATYVEEGARAADGFDLPVGDGEGGGSYRDASGKEHRGWRVATHFGERYALGIHPGEDWNGRGGGDTDLGQPVLAIGRGKVVVARDFPDPWGKVVVIDHLYFEGHAPKRVRSLYAHLSRIDVAEGAEVSRRQPIGAIGKDPAGTMWAHLHLELRTDATLPTTYWPSSEGRDLAWIRGRYLPPREFIEARRALPVPAAEPRLVLVDTARYRMRLYERRGGKLVATEGEALEVGFGQAAGRKRRRGDNRTPRGVYHVVSKARQDFGGAYGAYYGGHWIKVNYPGAHDAAWGLEQGLIDEARARKIREDWQARRLTDQKTELGSGIGFHGWKGEWEGEGGAHLSWGCVVMHNADIARLYDWFAKGTMVVLF
ncbi:MAG: peptidoglycan DD-metalloendopeptidase family protein [Deltaproteobacteria bacterium]|nr:peptidoglycan DD-metalloendopeptidase family protein [Deltaproteobacteria bacterium]